MKHAFSAMPDSMRTLEAYGFHWMDFVTAIPSPIFLATSYKANGLPNASLQSWTTFMGDAHGFYALLGSVSKRGHLYRTLRERGVVALCFPDAALYPQCEATIRGNGYDTDELAAAGLASEPCDTIDAPRAAACFLTLECTLLWEKERHEGDGSVVMCLQVRHIVMDDSHFATGGSRYGAAGYLYNIHSPVNPLTGARGDTALGVLQALPQGDAAEGEAHAPQ